MSDGTLCIELPLTPTAYQFQPGHSIRLQVASGAHPYIARNLGTGELLTHGTEMVTADQTIFHDTNHPSHLSLPFV
jgi:predicted acyl esterase